MSTVAFRGLRAHKRRLVGTFLSIFLGVAFLSGTLVLGDTLRANFDDLFTEANAGTDAVVRSPIEIDSDEGPRRGVIVESLVDAVESVEGVAAAEPTIEGYAQLRGADGDALGGNGPPRLGGSWGDDPSLTPYRLVEGRAPQTGDEVVINRGAAEDGDLAVGDRTTVETPEPHEVTIVGIATFGDGDGLGTTTYTAFTFEAAQEYLLGSSTEVSSVAVRADSGLSQAELVQRIGPALPEGVEVVAGAEVTEENVDDINRQFLDVFTTFLTVFAGVALLVGTFSIYNTFSILVAQRGRESALLRAIGASRGQILRSVLVEALLIGAIASIAGLFSGLAFAGLLKGLFDSFGFALPDGGLVFTSGTAAVSLAVGMIVTLVASVAPAVKASRVAPLAALRDVAVDRTGASPWRALVGLVLTAVGVAAVIGAVLGGGDTMIALAGLGALVTIVGLVVFGPVVARPGAGTIGWPVAKLRGLTGSLARQNAMRNPRRTSSTAAALLVGVGVVTLFTVFAASMKASLQDNVEESFVGDLAVTTPFFGGGGLSPELADNLDALPEVAQAAGLGEGTAEVDGDGTSIAIADPARLDAVLRLEVVEGSFADLADDQLAVSEADADDRDWTVGSPVPVKFLDGTATTFTVGAIYEPLQVVGDYVMTRAAWAPHAGQDVDSSVYVELNDGVDLQAGREAVEAAVAPFGAPAVEDRDGYATAASENIDIFLGVIYVMLALAIVIALMGIANTLSLSIHERTRELGLLRSVGQTRGQLRAMVRWESVIIAVFGTVGGIALGVFLGWALVRAASQGDLELSVFPWADLPGQLTVVAALGAIAGVLAGVRPARRAAKLDVLRAIATE